MGIIVGRRNSRVFMSPGSSDRVSAFRYFAFRSQHSPDGSQLYVTLVRNIQCNFQVAGAVYICDVHTYMQLNART